jgi:hypothetical protein
MRAAAPPAENSESTARIREILERAKKELEEVSNR